MRSEFVGGNVRADCPRCGVPTTFQYRAPSGGGEFGAVIENGRHVYENTYFDRIIHKTLQCCVCGRPAVATVHCGNSYGTSDNKLGSFWPSSKPTEKVPVETPDFIINELREAESCIEANALRAAAAMLRSTLEKTLVANGYSERNLYKKIEAAGKDGVITSARRQRAQDLVRTLGNDVLHEDWREIGLDEVEPAHRYVSRIIEDFYDDRETVVGTLVKAKRLNPEHTFDHSQEDDGDA